MPSTSDPAGPGTPTIRRAGPTDADAIHDLTRRAYAKWVPILGREPPPMLADYGKAVREDQVDLAIAERTLVALIHLVLRPNDVLVENLAVDPARQGQGLGAMMLSHADAFAAEAGKPAVRLYTNRLMGWNVAFYIAHGYAIEGEEPFGNGTRVHLFREVGGARPARR